MCKGLRTGAGTEVDVDEIRAIVEGLRRLH